MDEELKREVMFWSPNHAYKDGIPIPRATYRCTGQVKRKDSHGWTTHQCKLVTDHQDVREKCLCICDEEFDPRERQK